MSDPLEGFKQKSVDWRSSLKKNRRRTFWVIFSFIVIYLGVGFLIDLYWRSGTYPTVPLGVIAHALLTFQITPIATLIAGLVAVIALWVTFAMHDKIVLLGTEYRQITPETAQDVREKQLYNVIEEMKVAAGLRYMPKVFLIEANYMNAFASGYSEKSAMVAITRGLFEKLNREELTAVMAHELSHIRHMDIKLTLTASVLSNITLMAVDILFYGALFGGRSNDREGGGGRNILFIVIMVLRFVLPLITVLLMLYLSRTREYMADAGCVELMRNNRPLASALMKIQQDHADNSEFYKQEYGQTAHESVRQQAYIFDPSRLGISSGGLSGLFTTHPGIKKRLAAIGFFQKKT